MGNTRVTETRLRDCPRPIRATPVLPYRWIQYQVAESTTSRGRHIAIFTLVLSPAQQMHSCVLARQTSRAACEHGKTFGCSTATVPDAMWVQDGCRGVFRCNGQQMSCGFGGLARTSTSTICDCRKWTRRSAWHALHKPFRDKPQALPSSEELTFKRRLPCRTFGGAFFCGMEWDEWMLVRALLPRDSTVLELGARYGTTSCVIAQAQNNSGRLVAVEPDPAAHSLLLGNRAANRCNFAVVRGTVGDARLALDPAHGSYARQTRLARGDGTDAVPRFAFEEVEHRLAASLRQSSAAFDTILIDCEGCIEHALGGEAGRRLLRQVRLLLIEEDVPDLVDYAAWHRRLRADGFMRIWRIRDTFNTSATWSNQIVHSAWLKKEHRRSFALVNCPAYAKQHSLTSADLLCLEP